MNLSFFRSKIFILVIALLLISVIIIILKLMNDQASQSNQQLNDYASENYLKYEDPPQDLSANLDPETHQQIETLSIVSPLVINFNQPIKYPTLVYTITPEIKTTTESGKSNMELVIKPETFWQPDTQYTLTIKTLKAQGGAELANEFIINFKALNTADEEHSEVEINNFVSP
jgi:hypothetical protein